MISDSKVAVLSAIMKAPFSIMEHTDREHTAALSGERSDEVELYKTIVNGHFL